ncbi:YigZ family protein [Neobacillus piezotolerans]|uniref:YigZ family protein n=1 Tax=Neobacillus piezotolerans TaxID=2259171 RepID=A0A3D8GU64_9BACI|nr:YigZ family protein [Neobacillus piezotolerans]RDU37586.1 YigZ family protein [Neobacillus piezotolerans]
MLAAYRTVKQTGTHEIIIERSRFISHCARAESEAEAQDFIAEIKRLHRDATHNCSAYLIGENDQIQKANDDGEPSGTAGVPILEVLKKKKLKDTVVVVTRYFGGIKLGAGGLIRAYGKSASEGLNATGIVQRVLMQNMKVSVDYTWIGKLDNELRNAPYILNGVDYAEQAIFDIFVKENEAVAFTAWMTELTNGQASITKGGLSYLEEN